ncbi:ogr/Delta-like zinc finger family protein [Vibrio fluvialis]|uniref:ogr/Delta-like zinc finger family protein n=1 Tax=Vibrio fluvialis TaxID=676 RepID=UPI00192B1BAD|nr:ogr/Delta-like zinc finger family protein [Vibrio fluvialis]EKO3447581.1 ogr/Delta-like zinc finger family protein [Vibrio fluvialis]EKO3962832.1 ogr/Delta-like zinc finger family protein [Vibrio fluvialis]ELH7948891.1 ogr/Delta-like zinc finger family protein [Vibrio fluvialis]ELI5736687.1 ogr/Delta-like zinc finger family protein [Vibrio fluvialis]MBL4282184.1 ogr/Delta-like zinc finger family protein [Vibrio fluvialis]
MLITCPICESKARIATSKAMSKDTREAYCQCLNLNCGRAFTTLTTVNRIIEPTGAKPDPRLQPELCKGDVDQMDIFGALEQA